MKPDLSHNINVMQESHICPEVKARAAQRGVQKQYTVNHDQRAVTKHTRKRSRQGDSKGGKEKSRGIKVIWMTCPSYLFIQFIPCPAFHSPHGGPQGGLLIHNNKSSTQMHKNSN